ncbi:ABC-type oligopeptide transporter ABCB9-like [Protopterus annectens]|uniref:ABC-type oligopeptide transporter ABCB9-like n=1 Tax=Protopterus annectens TaxID=7888 RepID=UPI001CFBAF47|nr:ABC-type oligopeptide transporter ABCB9-like [Protopterus annectens]XP_043939244.1 ABC-type oligopeptide transporter ABCB9-like [Protopterus annectens]
MKLTYLLLGLVLFDSFTHYLLHWVLLLYCPFRNISFIWLLSCIRFPLTSGAAVGLLKKWDTHPGSVGTFHAFLYSVILCFISPVYETWKQMLLLKSPEIHSVLHLSLVMHLASAAAVLLWEFLSLAETSLLGKKYGEDAHKGDTQKADKATFRRLLVYSRPDVIPLCVGFTALILADIMDTFIPYYTGKVIDILGSKHKQDEFYVAIFLMSLFSVGSSVCSGLRSGLLTYTLSRLNRRIRNLLFQSIVQQEIGFFEFNKTGGLTSRLSLDTAAMSRSISAYVNLFLRSVLKTLGISYFMFRLSWQLTLLTLIKSPVFGLAQKFYNQYNQKLVQNVQDSIARDNDIAGEAVSCIKTVRSFATEEEEIQRYNANLDITYQLRRKRDVGQATYSFIMGVIQLSLQVAMLYFVHGLIQEGLMSTGNFVAILLYQADLESYIQRMIQLFGAIMSSVGAAEKVFDYLDREPCVSTDGKLTSEELKGHILFNSVSFSYPTRPEQQVLMNVSFELKPRQITALVGPNGSGKTTCVRLLERFYEPNFGEIFLDGIPLNEFDHKFLHSKIALVEQEPVLFAASIKDNISYGLSNCSIDDVIAAAQKANAHSFIQGLEKGYETDVGEKGGQLSAGQKQRIAIARALIRKPQILVLDEATSCLDPESEHLIIEAVSRMKDQTVLVIAHRLKTVEKANKIIVIENGSVIEEGTHIDLMKNQSRYYQMIQKIFGQSGIQENVS